MKGGCLERWMFTIDPSALVISIGDYGGASAQFGVKGNMPNPKTIDIKTGLQIYELTFIEYFRDLLERIGIECTVTLISKPVPSHMFKELCWSKC